jgi:hypothetical protein
MKLNEESKNTKDQKTTSNNILTSSLMISFSWNDIFYIGVIKIIQQQSDGS